MSRKPLSFLDRESKAIDIYTEITRDGGPSQYPPPPACPTCGNYPTDIDLGYSEECIYCGDPECQDVQPHGDSVAKSRDETPDFPFHAFIGRPMRSPVARAGYEQRWVRGERLATFELAGWRRRQDEYDHGVTSFYDDSLVLCERKIPPPPTPTLWLRAKNLFYVVRRKLRYGGKRIAVNLEHLEVMDSDSLRDEVERVERHAFKWRRLVYVLLGVKAVLLGALGYGTIHWWHIVREILK